MAIGHDPAELAGSAAAFDSLLPVLMRLDRRLSLAVERAHVAYGPSAAADRFRGLYLAEADVDRLLTRAPGAGAFFTRDPDDLVTDLDGSRLGVLARRYDLEPFDVEALVIALAPSVDLRYERIYAYLQDDVTRRRPTVDLALTLLCDSARMRVTRRAHFLAEAPLVRHRLLHIGGEAPASGSSALSATMELDDQVVHLLLGHDVLDRRLSSCCARLEPSHVAGADTTRVFSAETEHALDRAVSEARRAGDALRVHFQGPSGTGKRTAAIALAARAGVPLLRIDLARMLDHEDPASLFALALRHAWFQDLVVLVPEEGQLNAPMRDLLAHHRGIVILCDRTAPAGTIHGSADIVVPFVSPDASVRRTLWSALSAEQGIDVDSATSDALAARFRLTPRQIAGAVASAVQRERWLDAAGSDASRSRVPAHERERRRDALFAAARAQCGHELATLATRVSARRRWSDLVLPADTVHQLHEMCQRVAAQEKVFDEWGFAGHLACSAGVNALFSGSSGTGKTMAAEVLARELGVDLFRVDLSGVVSKYIGETEKNLDRVFTAAEQANGIVFFDEADALFGKRSEVRDSHDRYANIEISYLLQKMEEFAGVAILATNLRSNLDDAFVRRLAFAVHFPFPDEAAREQIWRGIWTPETPIDPGIDFAVLARQFTLSGGQIRNIALAAAFLAAARGDRVEHRDIIHATRREFQKLGKNLTVAELGEIAAV